MFRWLMEFEYLISVIKLNLSGPINASFTNLIIIFAFLFNKFV